MEERQEQKSSSSQDSVFYDKRSVISPSSHNPALGHPWSFWVILWVYHLITCWLQWTQVPLSDLGQSCSSWRWGSNLPSLESKISSVQSLSRVRLFVTPWITAHLASLSITNSQSLLKFMSIKSVMPSSHLILCNPLLLMPPVPPSIRVFSNESTLRMRWPKYWSFSFSISPSNEHPGLISFRMDTLVQTEDETGFCQQRTIHPNMHAHTNSYLRYTQNIQRPLEAHLWRFSHFTPMSQINWFLPYSFFAW